MKKICCMLLAVLLVPFVPQAYALDISATAAYVMDADTGETLYEYNADVKRTPASMTKVLTSYIVFQELEKGTLTLNTEVPISSHAAAISRDSGYPLSVPLTRSSYTVDTLLTLLHVPSASGACVALAEKVAGSESAFVARMNQTAKSLGLDAVYYNVHGCGPNKITARSQAKLTRHFIHTYPEVLGYTCRSSVYFEGKTYTNGNKLLDGNYEGCDGFKTGTYGDSGYCLSSTAKRNGRRVIAIAMNASNNTTRNTDSAKLLDVGFQKIAEKDASRNTTTITLSPSSPNAYLYSPFSVSVSLSGLNAVYYAKAQWYVNDQAVAGYGNDNFYARNGKVSTLNYIPDGSEGSSVKVSFVLTMPDGKQKSGDVYIPLTSTEITWGGYLNPSAVTAHPGVILPIHAVVYTENTSASMFVPAEWQIDGQPVQGYSNNRFPVNAGKGASLYNYFLPETAVPGEHRISFVLAKGTPNEYTVSCDITVITEDSSAA